MVICKLQVRSLTCHLHLAPHSATPAHLQPPRLDEPRRPHRSHAARLEGLAQSGNSPFAAMGDPARGAYGLQFHPEVTHTPQGPAILRAFAVDICGALPDWTPANVIAESVNAIRTRVGNEHVLCGLSGGVDSSVVAALLHEAIGDQLTCLFVENGLLRQGEAEQVVDTFQRHMHIRLEAVNAAEAFLTDLHGVTDPEQKRKLIGHRFIRVFEEEAARIAANWALETSAARE